MSTPHRRYTSRRPPVARNPADPDGRFGGGLRHGGMDGRTLFMVVREWSGLATMTDEHRVGEVLTIEARARHAGWP